MGHCDGLRVLHGLHLEMCTQLVVHPQPQPFVFGVWTQLADHPTLYACCKQAQQHGAHRPRIH